MIEKTAIRERQNRDLGSEKRSIDTQDINNNNNNNNSSNNSNNNRHNIYFIKVINN